jgi:hypothetical protein
MKKTWNVLAWILIVAAQIALGYILVLLLTLNNSKPPLETISHFLLTPLFIWLGYLIGIYGIGMLGLVLKKVKPLVPGLRLLTTAILAVLPMLMLIFNAVTVGVENQQQFQDLVINRMVPYYTQLCAVFSLLGFYITVWWHKAVPKKIKS